MQNLDGTDVLLNQKLDSGGYARFVDRGRGRRLSAIISHGCAVVPEFFFLLFIFRRKLANPRGKRVPRHGYEPRASSMR